MKLQNKLLMAVFLIFFTTTSANAFVSFLIATGELIAGGITSIKTLKNLVTKTRKKRNKDISGITTIAVMTTMMKKDMNIKKHINITNFV